MATNLVSNTVSTIDIVRTQLAPTPPSGGEGALVVPAFRSVSTGTTPVDFASVMLAYSEGYQIPADEVGRMAGLGVGKCEVYLPIIQR